MLIGEIFVQKHGVQPEEIERALQFQGQYSGLLGAILVNMGMISEESLIAALSEQLQLKTYQDIDTSSDLDGQNAVPSDLNIQFLLDRRWLPLATEEKTFAFAAVNPLDYEVNQYLYDRNLEWQTYIVSESQFRELEGEFRLNREMGVATDFDLQDLQDAEVDKLRELASEAPIVNLVNSLVSRAIGQGASDLHFEPYKNMYRVRFRIDGILHDIDFLPLKMQLPVASRIKILADLDIAEKRRPQDGQISMKVSGKEIDIRVSTLPVADGESLVLRFLVKESVSYELESLGLEKDLINNLNEDIAKTAGVILLTGPTGSGKTTTLYSCLNRINSEDKKIITIEDPVEYQLDGINQIHVKPDIGYDFLAALRSILRQDPDVLMVGEIRDGETAKVAMQSSLTGHLVFSTVHTNDAATAYTRLIDLGLPEYLINSALISVIAQRLVRRLCPECATPLSLTEETIASYGLDILAEKFNIPMQAKQLCGCRSCSQTGFKGRVAIMEYLRCTAAVKAMPKDNTFLAATAAYMNEKKIRNLAEDGFLKVLAGQTTLDETLRVCG